MAIGRDGDKVQARQRVNDEVKAGRRSHPNALPCTDCGHVWKKGERRHEYDHHLGYAAAHHLDVESVCSTCQHARGWRRGEYTSAAMQRGGAARAALKKSVCRFGHEMTRFPDGAWRCRTCRLEYWKRYNEVRASRVREQTVALEMKQP